jgi:multidrug efflux pump subunit AcrA (membrane-fusion protein)
MLSLRTHKWWKIGSAAGLVVGLLIGAITLHTSSGRHPQLAMNAARAEEHTPNEPGEGEITGTISVKTIRPRRDASLEMTVEQPAYVEAYYRADLRARVAGPVKYIQKNIGDKVTTNERLVEIDVPDLRAAVNQKQAVVRQRQSDLAVAEATVRIARAAQVAVEHRIKEYESQLKAAQEEKEYRAKRYARFKELAKGPSPAVRADIVDEELKWYNVAEANVASAESALLRAKADCEESKQKVEGALADVDLKRSLIQVAEEDRNQAQAMLDLATIRAPFSGVITQRGADPGSFVHNAATAVHTEPLLTVERTDIVTVVTKVPDRFSPYIGLETEAVISLDEMPGAQLRARVTRFTPSLQTPEHDRTMRVEVDLYNGSAEEYENFLAREKETKQSDLKGRVMPYLPKVVGKAEVQHHLLPGMYGKMQLVLHKFRDVYLLPSQAIVSHGGTPYIYVVSDGVAHQVPVNVEMDDGKLARVQLLVKQGTNLKRCEMCGKEEVVTSNQGELSDGQHVEAVHEEWK